MDPPKEIPMRPPLTPQQFLEDNLGKVTELFPTLIKPGAVPQYTNATPLEHPDRIVATIIEGVWSTIKDDPVVSALGRERFDSLPLEKRMEIVGKALDLLHVNKKVTDYLAQGTNS